MTIDVLEFVPVLRDDVVRRDVGDECVVWSPLATEPTALDPLAAVLLDVVDGTASIGQLAIEVHEEIGIPLETAQRRVREVVDHLDRVGLLATSTGPNAPAVTQARRDAFLAPSTPCSEEASRVGTEALALRFGTDVVLVTCDARRGARALRNALADHLAESHDDAPLAFAFTAPQGLQRRHELTDRAGFLLADGWGLRSGLHALASHLTVFLPPAPDTVRIRARAIVTGNRTIVCLDPLLYLPVVHDRELVRARLLLVDRLALDVDVRTGRIVNPPIPWPHLAALTAAPGHAGPHAVSGGVPATAVCTAAAGSPAHVVAQLARNGMHGSPDELVAASTALVAGSELRSVSPVDGDVVGVLRGLGASSDVGAPEST